MLPVVATLIVPWWLVHARMSVPATVSLGTAMDAAIRIVGVVLLLAGVALLLWCIRLFGRVGRGTLAPWDPTRRLVVSGPYRYVRNPMISAVAATLLGEAAALVSPRLVLWCVSFIVVNHIYFLASEEPGLRRRFGAQYERYRRAVPRWIPQRRPWADEHGQR
jgi:protein-S-isoprenylcysteine O-methyltransferase Ste14